jgi:hypothetical protein
MAEEPATAGTEVAGASPRRRNAVVLVVIVAFLILVLVKIVTDGSGPTRPDSSGADTGTSITSVRNDAVADFEAAAASGKPIYVLFHSLS